jgi:hypothetical protein
LCIRIIGFLSVIVLVVDYFGVRPDESKGDSPIATNPDGPSAFACSFERVKPKARKSHIFRLNSSA